MAAMSTFLLQRSNTLSDFEQVHFAAQAVVHGYDPYELIGPGRMFPWKWRFFYPLPAAIILAPLAPLPRVIARALFIFLSTTAYAWCVGHRLGRYGLFAIVNFPFALAATMGQWTPLLASILVLPSLGWLAIAKPSVGAVAVLVGVRERRPAVISAVVATAVVLLAFFAQPGWVAAWRASVATATHLTPYILRPGGVLLLLALLRWRRPEAWVLILFSCVPGSPGSYELLLPIAAFHFFGSMDFRASAALSLLTMPILPLSYAMPPDPFDAWSARAAAVNLIFVLLPLLVLLLRRPNLGIVPAIIERWAERLPKRLRGRAC
jgi:hypothetical protein